MVRDRAENGHSGVERANVVQASTSSSTSDPAAAARLIESFVDPMITIDAKLIITDVNQQMVRLVGIDRNSLIGTAFDVHFTAPARAADGIRMTLRDGFVTNYDLTLRSPSGREVLVSLNASTFTDAAGALQGVFAAIRDVTDQRRVEHKLRDQRNYNRSLIESSIDALMTVDPTGVITDVNEQTIRLMGSTREQLEGSRFVDHFTDAGRAAAGVAHTFHEGAVINYQLALRSKSGRESTVSFNASVFRNTAGQVIGILASARDITKQTQLEQQIREQNRKLTETTEFLNSVLESSTQHSIIAHDLDGTIVSWNEGARRNYGYSAEEMVGKQTLRSMHVPEDIASGRVDALIEAARIHGKAEGMFDRIRKDGHRFTTLLAVTLRRDASGLPVGYVLISKDVTEEKELERQLRRNDELEEQNLRVEAATRQKSEFLATMSHELRTPLNGIIGLAELMHDEKVGAVSTDHKEYLRDILTSSGHLLQLINDVLDLAKVESGKIEFHPEVVHLERLVGEVRDILRALSAQRGLRIDCEIDPGVEQVVADPARLKQILYNFLSNALKFTADGGHIVVRALPEGPHDLRLEVADTGIGIRTEDFGQLFVEFEQLDRGSAKKYPGTGLGLALTRRIVEAQGGHVGVNSTSAKGSTFFAILPRIAHSGSPDPTAPSPRGASVA